MTRQDINSGAPAAASDDARRLAGIVLVRLATGPGTETEIARELAPLVPTRGTPEIWRIELARLLAALTANGLVARTGNVLSATEAGIAAAREFLGPSRSFPASWPAARDFDLVARALGLETLSAANRKLLAKADGLRALIVVRHWSLKVRGRMTPSRIRAALAVKALERAFGNQIKSGLGDKSSLPAKAGRLLASQLSATPRDFGTDARLISALAAEAVGARRPDLKSLQAAVLRQFVGDTEATTLPAPRRQRRDRRKLHTPSSQQPGGQPSSRLAPESELGTTGDGHQAAASQARPVANPAPMALAPATASAAPQPVSRPDPEGFATAVNASADAVAEGWAGNRKAFISKVWETLQGRHPEWALTDIEFKCMLAEAHRTGLVVLANADLKDRRHLRELQSSAVIYKNTVWHYVRVQD